jgi:demethylmenaquinone methyltransferase/2-methoxy-6-polyprenyl-1,4-benzoquinol methylase
MSVGVPGARNLLSVETPSSPLPPTADKRARVREMFDAIAPRYDLVNGLMTFGLDGHWRKRTISLLDTPRGSLVADIGSGTGDLARAVLKAGHRAVGVDLSMGMLRAGQPGGAPMVLADAAMMPLEDRAVDAAVSGFALRNFAELHAVVVEIARVVRPGGRIALLEVALPEHPLMKLGHRIWFNQVVPRIGAALSDAAAYRYLPASVAYLPGYSELAGMLGDAGFTSMRRDLLSGGVVQVVTATRAGFRPVTGPLAVVSSARTSTSEGA